MVHTIVPLCQPQQRPWSLLEFFILFSTFAFASAPQVVVDEVPSGSLSLWEVGNFEYNPVLTYQEIVSPHDGSTAIETSVVGNTIMMCETKSLKRKHEYGGNTSDTDLQAYLAFTSSMSYYNLPYVVIQLFSADDTVVGSQLYYDTPALYAMLASPVR